MLNKNKALDHVETVKLAIEKIEAAVDAYERNQNQAAIQDCYSYLKKATTTLDYLYDILDTQSQEN
jgi:rubrerythrin